MDGDVLAGKKKLKQVPERRPPRDDRAQIKEEQPVGVKQPAMAEKAASAQPATGLMGVQISLSYPVWRCRVCGYLCAREKPPGVCPICKATKERFERFM